MNVNEILTVLKNGDKFYLNVSESLVFESIEPATKDEYTHYIYFDKKLKLFYEYSRKDKKEIWVDPSRVKQLIQIIIREQQKVDRFFNSRLC